MKKRHFGKLKLFFLDNYILCNQLFSDLYYIPKKKEVIKVFKKNYKYKAFEDNSTLSEDVRQTLLEHHVILPKEKVYIKKELRGYITDYVEGYTPWEFKNKDINIRGIEEEDIKRACNIAREDVRAISNLKVYMRDLHSGNMVYDVKRKVFCFIDTDLWSIMQDSYEEENMNCLEMALCETSMVSKIKKQKKR